MAAKLRILFYRLNVTWRIKYLVMVTALWRYKEYSAWLPRYWKKGLAIPNAISLNAVILITNYNLYSFADPPLPPPLQPLHSPHPPLKNTFESFWYDCLWNRKCFSARCVSAHRNSLGEADSPCPPHASRLMTGLEGESGLNCNPGGPSCTFAKSRSINLREAGPHAFCVPATPLWPPVSSAWRAFVLFFVFILQRFITKLCILITTSNPFDGR